MKVLEFGGVLPQTFVYGQREIHAGTIQDISGWQIWLDYPASNGVATLAFQRSGYVESTKMPGRITINVANEVSELANSLAIKRMVNFGLSGGE